MYKDKSIEFIKVQTIFSLDSDRNKKNSPKKNSENWQWEERLQKKYKFGNTVSQNPEYYEYNLKDPFGGNSEGRLPTQLTEGTFQTQTCEN